MSSFFRVLSIPSTLRWVALLVGALACGHAAADEPAPRMAMGVIVKLKDRNQDGQTQPPAPIVRLMASAVPSDGAARIRLRLSDVARRHSVSYLLNKPTAFAAQVIHSGHPVPIAQAQAEAARLRADPDVEWALPNEILTPSSITVSDPSEYAAQTWLKARGTSNKGVGNIESAWTRLNNSGLILTPVVVAVLDSGILDAPDLGGRLLPGYDFVSEVEYSRDGNGLDNDPSDPGDWLTDAQKAANPQLFGDLCPSHDSRWHGLAITNMLAAAPNTAALGGVGILSPLPGGVVLPVRVSGVCGASTSDILEGMLWAAGIAYQGSPPRNPNPARVINFSFGGDGTCSDPRSGTYDWLYRQTVQQLRNYGVLVVAAAGNGTGHVGKATLDRPANCDGVLAVTSLNMSGHKAIYANLTAGKAEALSVAGGDGEVLNGSAVFYDDGIVTVTNAGEHEPIVWPDATHPNPYIQVRMAGTSFSAPTVAGVAALMLAANPSLSVAQLIQGLTTQTQIGGSPPASGFFPTVGSFPTCDAASASTRGQCNCTTATCGAGILDADRAVAWALAQSTTGSSPYDTSNAYWGGFVPDRLTTPTRKSGGGGGGLDVISLMLMGAALAATVLGRRRVRTGRR